ncbi:hypothetical protein AAC387_Pa07g0547 [Persea americana]
MLARKGAEDTKQQKDLNESRFELLTQIQGLKPELQNWRLKFDTEVKVYCNNKAPRKEWLPLFAFLNARLLLDSRRTR